MHDSLYAAVGADLVYFLTCVTRRVERVNFCVGEDSCSSQTTMEGSESILYLSFVPQTKR